MGAMLVVRGNSLSALTLNHASMALIAQRGTASHNLVGNKRHSLYPDGESFHWGAEIGAGCFKKQPMICRVMAIELHRAPQRKMIKMRCYHEELSSLTLVPRKTAE